MNGGDGTAHNAWLPCTRRIPLGVVIIVAAVLGTNSARGAPPPTPFGTAVIRGSSVYAGAALFAAYQGQLGRPLTPAVANAVTAALGRMYERDGYSRPELQVNDPLMATGILRIDVFEPRFTRVTFSGAEGPYHSRLAALGTRIQASNPVRPAQVQRSLQLMRTLPGLSVIESVARDASVRNGFVLTLTVAYRPVEGLVEVSNQGSKEIGPVFITGQLVSNGLLGHDEKLGALFTATTEYEEYHAAGAFGELPVSDSGTRVSLLGLYSYSVPHVSPGDPLDTFRRALAQLRVTQPFLLGGAPSLTLVGGLDVDNQITEQNTTLLRDDRLRVADLGAQAAWGAGASTRYSAVFDLRQGLNALGSQLYAADLMPDLRSKDFLLERLRLTQLNSLGELWSLRLDAILQHSAYVLPYSEQLTIGGQVLGHGFEVSQVAGDSGGDARIDLRRRLARFADSGELWLYGYYDYGIVWSQDGNSQQCAALTGLGVAFSKGSWSGTAEVAQPLIHPDVDGSRSPRILAQIAKHF
jgi:hemolysin activation/secretion protein